MAAVTREDIRDAVLFRADLPASEPRRVSNAQIDTLINRSMRRLQGILESFHSEDYLRSQQVVNLLASSPTVPLTGQPKILHVLWKLANASGSQDQYLRLGTVGEFDIATHGTEVEAWSRHDAPRWTINTTAAGVREITFVPVPGNDEDLLLVTQLELVYADDVETREIDYAWEEWVVLDCLVAIRQRDKQDAGDILGERERTEIRIREQAPERKKDERVTVLDRDLDFARGTEFIRRFP